MLYRMNRFTLNDKFDILVGALEQGSKYFDKGVQICLCNNGWSKNMMQKVNAYSAKAIIHGMTA